MADTPDETLITTRGYSLIRKWERCVFLSKNSEIDKDQIDKLYLRPRNANRVLKRTSVSSAMPICFY